MDSERVPNEQGSRKKQWWLIAFGIFSIAIAFFWSIDKSLIYLLLAGAAFSLFKVLQFSGPVKPKVQGEERYESYSPSRTWLFLQEVKTIFSKRPSGPQTPQQTKVFITLVLAFIGFIFFSILITIFFADDSSSLDSSYYYQRATDFNNSQQYDSAAYYYRLAILDDAENAELYLERGNTFLNLNEPDSALVMYDRTLAIEPHNEQAQYNKGYVYFNRKSYTEAIDETKKILEYNPDYNDAMLLIGDSFYNKSQLDSALHWYERAYSNGYRSAILCHLMAYICDVKGQTNRAIDLYREAIGQDSSIVDIYTRLGELVPGDEGDWFRQRASQMK